MKLEKIKIENFNLISTVEIELSKGLNVIGGESGSGKSLIFRAIRAVLGANSSPSDIRVGCDKAIITAIFDELIIQKIITSKRSYWTVEGEVTSQKIIQKIYKDNFYSFTQGDQFALYQKDKQLEILDDYICKQDSGYKSLLTGLRSIYTEYENERNNLARMKKEYRDLESSIDYDQYSLEQLDKIEVTEEEWNSYFNSESNESLSEEEISKHYDFIYSQSFNIKKLVITFEELNSFFNNNYQVYEKIRSFSDSFDFIKGELFENIKARSRVDISKEQIEFIENLMRIHRCSYFSDLMITKNNFEKKVYDYKKLGEDIEISEIQIVKLKTKYFDLAKKVSDRRKEYCSAMYNSLRDQLLDLNFSYIEIIPEIIFSQEVDKISITGSDNFSCLLSFNKGIEPKPIEKVISGGEASRISLSILSLVDIKDRIFLLDEIDSGLDSVSLSTMAKKLKFIAEEGNQIISISHNAEIKLEADKLITVEKDQSGDVVETKIVMH